jgi:serine protease Do
MNTIPKTRVFALAFIFAGIMAFAVSYEKKQEATFNDRILFLQKELAQVKEDLVKEGKAQQNEVLSLKEMLNREQVIKKSQDELLTAAVSKNSPAVVSIVISKDVPQLEVVYQNPFGDDPFFKDFGFQIPVYRQNGVTNQKVGAGSGFLVTGSGYIITNKHVVADDTASYTVLLSSGKQEKATVVYKDPTHDVALIKIAGANYPIVSVGDSRNLKLGQTVVAIGNALGEYNNSVSVGIVSGLNRTIEASGGNITEKLVGIIQTDAAINPGNSGGPLLDLDGKVIGVNVATVAGSSNISFSIPINAVREAIKKMVSI